MDSHYLKNNKAKTTEAKRIKENQNKMHNC